MVAGRGSAAGCGANQEPAWSLGEQRFVFENMSAHWSLTNCSLLPISLRGRTAFFLELGEGDKAWMRSGASTHGGSSRPWSQCEGYGESACNADGVLWTRTLHQGELIVESAASEGRLVGALKDRLVVAAHFKGVRGGPHQGLRVPGLPPPPFFSSDDANIESLLLGLTA